MRAFVVYGLSSDDEYFEECPLMITPTEDAAKEIVRGYKATFSEFLVHEFGSDGGYIGKYLLDSEGNEVIDEDFFDGDYDDGYEDEEDEEWMDEDWDAADDEEDE
jgi:hypothetical protein